MFVLRSPLLLERHKRTLLNFVLQILKFFISHYILKIDF